MAYPKTPELDKLTETFTLTEFTQRLGEALDSKDGFVLAEWVPYRCRKCGGHGTVYNMRANEDVPCDRCKRTGYDPDEITLAHRSPSNRNLAILFGLDHEKMETEREAVLKHVQAEARGRST